MCTGRDETGDARYTSRTACPTRASCPPSIHRSETAHGEGEGGIVQEHGLVRTTGREREETYHGYLGQETALDEGRDGQKLMGWDKWIDGYGYGYGWR